MAALFIRGVGRNGACNIDGAGMKYSRCQPPRHILRAGSIPAPELKSCVKVEVAVPNKPHGFCGRKAPLKLYLSCEPVWPSGKALGW